MRAIALHLRYGLGPHEILNSGLIDPGIPADAVLGCIGQRRLIEHQRRFNPQQWACLVEDKAVFYAYCAALGLSTPKLYAVFDKPSGWTAAGQVVSERAEWERFLENDLPQEFIVKPALGVYGQGLNLYRRTGDLFEDQSGQTFSARSLYERLQTGSKYSRFVIQERVLNHPEIQSLTDSRSLQTARIVTWLSKDGDIEIYHAFFKLILGKNVSDNFNSGRSGNMIVNIDPNTGELAAPLAASPDGFGCKVVPVHPVTGINIPGTRLPHWSLARQLTDRAARLFLPLRTIGWDIALTADGPVLMEGNAWWDPLLQLVAAPHASGRRRQELAQFVRRFASEA